MFRPQLGIALCLLLVIICLGTVGYMNIENVPFFESLYMTIITISSVGFSEIVPLSRPGRILTICIIISGIGTLTYTMGQIAHIFIEGEIRKIFGRRKLEKEIARLEDHFIICGYGRIGEVICKELAEEKIPFVVLEHVTEKIQYLDKAGYLYMNKDATTEEALLQAGLERAKGLVTAVSTDADNVFITLTAKNLNPEIFILSRAADLKNERKLLRAGASRVVCPYYMGGSRMAQILKKPTVVDFLDTAMMSGDLGLKMEEALIHSSSKLVGKTLVESRLRMDFGVIIVAIKKASNEMVFNPGPTAKLEAGDVIVVIGKQEEMSKMWSVLE